MSNLDSLRQLGYERAVAEIAYHEASQAVRDAIVEMASAGYTQVSMASRLGCSPQRVSKILREEATGVRVDDARVKIASLREEVKQLREQLGLDDTEVAEAA